MLCLEYCMMITCPIYCGLRSLRWSGEGRRNADTDFASLDQEKAI